jgi:hypothetical protein
MNKYFLKFEDEQAFLDAISETSYNADNETMFMRWGELAKETGNTLTDNEGNEYPEMIPVLGYHVDMYLEDDEIVDSFLNSFIIAVPNNPVHRLR